MLPSKDEWTARFTEMGFEESEAVIFAEKFVAEKIRNEIFGSLNDDDLIVIGIKALGDRRIILRWIEKSGDGEKRTSRSLNDVPIKKAKLSLRLRMGNSFQDMCQAAYYVDKTMIIQEIFQWFYKKDVPIHSSRRPLLIYAPRRFGKTTVLDLMECFFGGGLTTQYFSKFKIGGAVAAFEWHDKFSVVYVDFASGKDLVQSRDDCVTSCRMILHETFKSYDYIQEYLSACDQQAFKEWCHETAYKEKTDVAILLGLRFLIQCIISYAHRPVFLLIDEFDNICARAMYNTSKDNLKQIIEFYSKMIANVVKHNPIVSGAVFTGITPITCLGYSDLNNTLIVDALRNDSYCKYYGILVEEFSEVMTRKEIPEKVRKLKEKALHWYNGYSFKNYRFLNPFSVSNFIELGEVKLYWKRSGMAIGLLEAVRQDAIRMDLKNTVLSNDVDDKFLKIFLKEFSADDFTLLKDDRFEITDANFVFNFLLQQGYFTLCPSEETGDTSEDVSLVKIPNEEVKRTFEEVLSNYYLKTYKFDPEKIDECFILFKNMNFSSRKDCKIKMASFKKILVELLSKEPCDHMNESWFECFLYTIFYQSAEIKSQIKVEETAIGNDMRTAKVLDLFLKMGDKIFILEETMICSGEQALEKLIEKKYYLKVGESKSYMLIGIGVNKHQRALELSDITISFLVNSFEGQKTNV